MRLFRSVQFNVMLAMLLVTIATAIAIHHTYITWILESQRRTTGDRLERALAHYTATARSGINREDTLLRLQQRYDIDGLGLFDPASKTVIINLGLPKDFLSSNGWSYYWKQFLADKEHSWQINPDGTHMVSMREVEFADKHRYLVAATLSLANEMILHESLGGMFTITLCGSVVITLLLSYLLRRRIVHSLFAFNDSMDAVASGDLSRKVPMNTDLEFIPLATGFNRMLGELEENRAELLDYQQTLEDKIKTAREELHKKDGELLQAEKLASIGELAAGVAHEINNPLQSILLASDILKQDCKDEALNHQLELIQKQTRLCRNIVTDLLEYSRSGALTQEPLDLEALLQQTANELLHTDKLANIELEWQLPENAPQICGSEEELRRVFLNILLNAAQALQESNKDFPHICIRESIEDSAYLLVRIEDNGPGVSPEILARVFEPFFTTKEFGKGTGLGLSIAYGIIARHRGTITLDSQPGIGTTVSVRLPILEKSVDYHYSDKLG